MILIVGCGFLGSYILDCASSQTNEKILVTALSDERILKTHNCEYMKCDVTNEDDLYALAEKCKDEILTVFYLASCHNIDYVYEHPQEAEKINVKALKNFISIIPCIEKLFYASTDCVYGEGKDSKKTFSENSPLNPINEYGRQKVKAEDIVIANGFNVIRYPFMLGKSLTEKPHFYDYLCDKLIAGKEINMIDGMKRSVISYSQAAAFTFQLSEIETGLPQIINVCSDETLSKYEVGRKLAEKLNVSSDLIKKISEKDGEAFFKEKRASYVAMDNSLFKSLCNLSKISWEEKLCL